MVPFCHFLTQTGALSVLRRNFKQFLFQVGIYDEIVKQANSPVFCIHFVNVGVVAGLLEFRYVMIQGFI